MSRVIAGKLWILLGITTIAFAILLSIARVLTPYASAYKTELGEVVGAALGQPLTFETLEAEWSGFGPRLYLSGVDVLDRDGSGRIARFEHVTLGVDLFYSLLSGRYQVSSVAIAGFSLTIRRGAAGDVSVAGFEGAGISADPGVAAAGGRRVLAWLLSQTRVALEDAEIIIADGDGEIWRFREVNLELRNDGPRHQFTGSTLLPISIGRRLSFAADIQGRLLRLDDWKGELFVSGGGLDLAALVGGLEFRGLALNRGNAELSWWSRWDHGQITQSQGVVSLFDIAMGHAAGGDPQVPATPEEFLVSAAAGGFSWVRQTDGWQLSLHNLAFDRDQHIWPFGGLNLRWSRQASGASIEANIEYLDLHDVSDFLHVAGWGDPGALARLEELNTQGALHNAYLYYADGDLGRDYRLVGTFKNLSFSAHERLPGISGLDGRLALDPSSGIAELHAQAVDIDAQRLFRNLLTIDHLDGVVKWRKDAQGWALSADGVELVNADLAARARMRLEVPQDGAAPFLALSATYSAATVENLAQYLPARIMPGNSVAWLERAIVAGRVPRGTLLYFGHRGAFPFEAGDGRFEARFDVDKLTLDYADGWPRLEEVAGEVVFANRSLKIAADTGRSFSSRIERVDAEIADLASKPALLALKGTAAGATADVVHYLLQTPLQSRFAPFATDLRAGGASHLDLSLKMPLAPHPTVSVAGELALTDSEMVFGAGGPAVEAINGQLSFSEKSLAGRGLMARVLGVDAEVDIATVDQPEGQATEISARGRASAAQIRHIVHVPVMDRLQGETPWRGFLHIPHALTDGRAQATVSVESNLEGLEILLPRPLAKTAGESWNMSVTFDLPRSLDTPLRLRVSDKLAGVFDLDEHMRAERAALALGGGEPDLPSGREILIAVKSDDIVVTPWMAYIRGDEADPSLPAITRVRMEAGRAELYGYHFHDTALDAVRREDDWRLSLRSEEVAGVIDVPQREDAEYRFDLEHLKITERDGGKGLKGVDPRGFPPLTLSCKRFEYNGVDFGELRLQSFQHPSGLRLEQLQLSSAQMQVNARGNWLIAGAEQYSSFEISFDSDDVGSVLTMLGYADTIRKGKTHFDISARWLGPPTSFDVDQLDGTIFLRVSNGRLLEVDPGAGRIFGLISLQALPRRLMLDFSDLFAKGFTFDEITGNFKITNGIAVTHDLSMSGPAAAMHADGTIDMRRKTYDQLVTVTPEMKTSLPLAGAVAGGIGVGAAILLIEKMLRPNLEKITTLRFKVTGPWDKPDVVRLQE